MAHQPLSKNLNQLNAAMPSPLPNFRQVHGFLPGGIAEIQRRNLTCLNERVYHAINGGDSTPTGDEDMVIESRQQSKIAKGPCDADVNWRL